jgi:imidazolonepropionase-like amidohydrolase
MALMQEAGLTPLEVLRSATVNGAKAARREGDLGAIEPGRLADLVILDDDPLRDSANLSHIRRVIKDGIVFDPIELMRSIQ